MIFMEGFESIVTVAMLFVAVGITLGIGGYVSQQVTTIERGYVVDEGEYEAIVEPREKYIWNEKYRERLWHVKDNGEWVVAEWETLPTTTTTTKYYEEPVNEAGSPYDMYEEVY